MATAKPKPTKETEPVKKPEPIVEEPVHVTLPGEYSNRPPVQTEGV